MGKKPTRQQFLRQLDKMVSQLRNDMLDGTYASGSYLPSEASLAEQFGLSNKSVRKGLEQLVEEGLIAKIHRVGNRVKPQHSVTTLTLGCPSSVYRDIELERLVEDFHQQHPSIRVRIVLSSVSGSQAYKDYAEAGLVDVMTMSNLQFDHLIEDGSGLTMLEPLIASDRIYPFARESFTTGGRLYAQPVVFSPVVLCYNKEHFRESGLLEPDGSWTWDDALRCAAALSNRKDRHGLYFFLASENRWPLFWLQSGEALAYSEEGACDIRGTKLLRSLRLSKTIIQNRELFPAYMSEGSDDVNRLFLDGQVSMILTTYMSMNDFKHSDLAYDVSPVPFIQEPRTLAVSIGIGLNKHSRQKEAARLLVDYFASERAQQLIRNHTLSLPAVKPIAESDANDSLNRPRHEGQFRSLLFSMRWHRDLNVTREAFYGILPVLKAYWADMIDEEKLCEQLAAKIRLRPGSE